MDSPAANATETDAASTAAAPADATEPPVDNWAADHKRKGTVLKKNTRKSAEESRVQTNEQFDRYYRSQLGPLLTADDGEWERMEAVIKVLKKAVDKKHRRRGAG